MLKIIFFLLLSITLQSQNITYKSYKIGNLTKEIEIINPHQIYYGQMVTLDDLMANLPIWSNKYDSVVIVRNMQIRSKIIFGDVTFTDPEYRDKNKYVLIPRLSYRGELLAWDILKRENLWRVR